MRGSSNDYSRTTDTTRLHYGHSEFSISGQLIKPITERGKSVGANRSTINGKRRKDIVPEKSIMSSPLSEPSVNRTERNIYSFLFVVQRSAKRSLPFSYIGKLFFFHILHLSIIDNSCSSRFRCRLSSCDVITRIGG